MKILSLLLLFIFISSSKAQTYINITTDVTSDCTCSCMDITSFDYAFDIAQDSVWFKVTTNNARTSNYGYHIVVNKDNNLSNGDSWSGASSGPCMGFINFNMSHDRMIAVWPSLSFVEAYDGTGGTILHYNVLKKLLSPTVTVIGVHLSEVDADMDGVFDVILGLGDEYYVNNDAAPNTGYVTTMFLGSNEAEKKDVLPLVYPNPCTDILHIENTSEACITDLSGKIIQVSSVIENNKITFNVLKLEAGFYLIKTAGGNLKFVKY
jgi:Secretion system C-terminal sorting domain